jgi:hypothetical protein
MSPVTPMMVMKNTRKLAYYFKLELINLRNRPFKVAVIDGGIKVPNKTFGDPDELEPEGSPLDLNLTEFYAVNFPRSHGSGQRSNVSTEPTTG